MAQGVRRSGLPESPMQELFLGALSQTLRKAMMEDSAHKLVGRRLAGVLIPNCRVLPANLFLFLLLHPTTIPFLWVTFNFGAF